ncbi:MAG: glycerophosphodiester phosphodiesterase family protein [Acidobacteriota bacterium]
MGPHREVIAHRGASASAPENTMSSFELAATFGAGSVETDLHVTSDGALVCLHDRTLERTTNVREVFPDRGRAILENGSAARRWFVHDLTLDDVRRLDAGSWFGPAFAQARIVTFDELLDWARTRIAVLAELKDPEVYSTFGVDMLGLCAAALQRHGLVSPSSSDAVAVQSFHEDTVRRAGAMFGRRTPVALLVEPADGTRLRRPEDLAEIARFATRIAPGKAIVGDRPDVVTWAHDAGLQVTPWTFRASTTGAFADVGAEIDHYLVDLGVDAVITDHPGAYVARHL